MASSAKAGRQKRPLEHVVGPRPEETMGKEVDALRDELTRLQLESVAFKTVMYAEIPGLTVTRTEAGELVAITRTDNEHRILELLWESETPNAD